LIDRMPTGIPGLDNMMEGGLPKPSLILLAGDAGAGKTTFCTQFLCKGADLGERGLYLLTFGGRPICSSNTPPVMNSSRAPILAKRSAI